MAKNDSDLFERLRRAGLRKQVARTLSQIDGAGKKTQRAAHGAVAEMRAVADELERRLSAAAASAAAPAVGAARRRASTARTSARGARSAAKPAAVKPPAARGARSRAATGARTASAKPARARAASARGTTDNTAKVLAALKGGPKTASEIAAATGVANSTVASALRRLTASGAVVKAARGYGLAR